MKLISPDKIGFYSGVISSVFAMSNLLGPLLGGIISDRTTWRWVFFLKYVNCFWTFCIQADSPKWPNLGCGDGSVVFLDANLARRQEQFRSNSRSRCTGWSSVSLLAHSSNLRATRGWGTLCMGQRSDHRYISCRPRPPCLLRPVRDLGYLPHQEGANLSDEFHSQPLDGFHLTVSLLAP